MRQRILIGILALVVALVLIGLGAVRLAAPPPELPEGEAAPPVPDALKSGRSLADLGTEGTTAQELVQGGRFAEAKAKLTALIEKHPDNAETRRWLGDTHYNLLELDEALAAYEKALELDADNYYARRGRGFALLYRGHRQYANRLRAEAHESYREALKTLRECLRHYPEDIEAHYVMTMACEGASRRLYTNAIRLHNSGDQDPEAEDAARACLEMIDRGIEAAQKRIEHQPAEKGPRLLLAGLFHRRGALLDKFERPKKAAENLQQAIEAYRGILLEIDSMDKNALRHIARIQKLRADVEARPRKPESMIP